MDEGKRDSLEAFAAQFQRSGVDSAALLDPATSDLFAVFAEAGVDALLLKGAGLQRLLYHDGERRAYADVDLLVAPAHQEAAERILTAAGYHNASAELGIDDVGGVVHADTWVGMPAGTAQQIVVEVHRWLPGATAEPATAWAALWAARTEIVVDARTVPVLDRPGQALGLATHAGQHGPGFAKGLAELRLALERWPADVWADAAQLADAVGATRALAAGLRLIPEGSDRAGALGLPDTPELEWEIHNAAERPRGAFHVDAFRTARGPAAKLHLLRRALLPDARWIRTEYPWAAHGRLRLCAAYGLHVLRAPVWAARAWLFRRRAPRS